ncbi:hypothetical protein L7F22_015215 [Adiantum nelumboides]|nr:hypothetical protein [Adiantum nelumboides]MCO5561594.1 hypothetical protein [Adiantum nelumboides]
MPSDHLDPTQLLVTCDPIYFHCWVGKEVEQAVVDSPSSTHVYHSAASTAAGKYNFERGLVIAANHETTTNNGSSSSSNNSGLSRAGESEGQPLLMASRVNIALAHQKQQLQQQTSACSTRQDNQLGYSVRTSLRAGSSSNSQAGIHNHKTAAAQATACKARGSTNDDDDEIGDGGMQNMVPHSTCAGAATPQTAAAANHTTGGQQINLIKSVTSTHQYTTATAARVWKTLMCSSVLLLCSITALVLLLPLVLPGPIPPPPLELLLLPLFILLLLMCLALSPTLSPAFPTCPPPLPSQPA